MRDETLAGPWIRRFLLEHLIADRNLAHHTQASYRDTLLLWLPFVARVHGKTPDRLTVEQLGASHLRSFLDYIEKERHCSVATRNLRLSAIHSLAKFIGQHSPQHLAWCAEIRAVPFKKTAKSSLTYLDAPEIDALLKVPDQQTPRGRRDYALLLFLYNTGARAEETTRLTAGDVTWGNSPAVRLNGKGGKQRWCPIWKHTAQVLREQSAGRGVHDVVFRNRLDRPLTRFGLYSLVHRTVAQASRILPSLASKRVSTHCMRHSCAVHLLRSGVDINTIRAWLGHVSLDTTHVYAEVDLEMKAKALAQCDSPNAPTRRSWHTDAGLISFLKAL
jgi:integrase/recombinase XerD